MKSAQTDYNWGKNGDILGQIENDNNMCDGSFTLVINLCHDIILVNDVLEHWSFISIRMVLNWKLLVRKCRVFE